MIDCENEFGYELALYIPYAYYLHTKGLLKKTVSCMYTKELYYFSDNHEEKYKIRKSYVPYGIPNIAISTKHLNYNEWISPPYKKIFNNDILVFSKPLFIVHNKYNSEWGHAPINFLDINTLDKIFNILSKKYTVVYFRPKTSIIKDNSEIYNLKGEEDLIEKYSIINSEDLYKKYNFNNFNHFQLCIHSNCENFISVQGGTSYLCSLFSGRNIIYAVKGSEVTHNSFDGFFKKFSNCEILHAKKYEDIIKWISS